MSHMWVVLLAGLAAGDSHTAQQMLRIRLMALQNVTAEFDKQEIHNPSPKLSEVVAAHNRSVKTRGGATLRLKKGEISEKGKFSFIDGLARFETTGPTTGTLIKVFLGDRTEVLIHQRNELTPRGLISDSQPAEDFGTIDYALGLRLYGSRIWLTPDCFEGVITNIVDGKLRLELRDETAPLRVHVWTVDPDLSYAILRYQVLQRRSMLKPGSDVADEILVAEVKNRDFVTVDGIGLPRSIQSYQYREENGLPTATTIVTLNAATYTVGADDNNRESIQIEWPVGSNVVDERTAIAVNVESRPQVLTDQILSQAAAAEAKGGRSIRKPPGFEAKPTSIVVIVNVISVIVIAVWCLVRRRFVR